MAEVEICRCKYLLPCGRCDKRGAPCDATIGGIEAYSLMKTTKCNHDWIIEVTKSDYIDGYGNECCVVHQHCSKCGMTDVRIQPFKT